MTDLYRVGERELSRQKKRRRRRLWAGALVILLLLIFGAFMVIRDKLKPKTTIKQSNAHVTKVSYDTKVKHYSEPDFGIDLPGTWRPLPRPAGPYQSYTWQSSDRGSNGQIIEVFEDTIPLNFAVNRELEVDGNVDHMEVKGAASDNCSNYTQNTAHVAGQIGVQAKWQDINFLCDQSNTERDVIGTGSKDGINTVLLRTSLNVPHKFFFTYTDYAINPDYSVFYNSLLSFHMQ